MGGSGGSARRRWAWTTGFRLSPYYRTIRAFAASSGHAVAVTDPQAVQGGAEAAAFGPPYPFDAIMLWSKLTEVAALPAESLTHGMIESIFGVKLKRGVDHNPSGPLASFEVRGSMDWYYDLSWQQQGAERWFTFGWGQAPGEHWQASPPPRGGICIKQQTVRATLTGQGWRFEGAAVGVAIPARDHYRMAGKMLSIDFDRGSDCLLAMLLIDS